MCHAVNNPGLGTMNSKHLKRKKENSFLFRLNFFLTRVCVCVKVAESCLTLWLHGLYLPGSSVDGILQARILEWVAVSFYPSSIFSVSSNAKGHPPPPRHNIHTSFHPSTFSLVSLGPVCHLISCGERPSWGNLCCQRDKGIFLSPDASLVKTIALKDLKLALFLGKNMS